MTNVKVYSTPTCPWCKKVKDYLKKKKVEFVDSLMCSAYIFNIKDINNFEYGKQVVESEIRRGND